MSLIPDPLYIVQGGLIIAFVGSLVCFFEDRHRQPFSDPWFIPIIFIILWISFTADPLDN
jgi:hypothetical protein